MRELLEKTYPDSGVLTVPFTDRVAVYMRAADVLLSKAGGISSSEAAVCEVPLVHTMVIPGVEVENAEFFAAHGMSCFAKQPAEAPGLQIGWLLTRRRRSGCWRRREGPYRRTERTGSRKSS